MSSEFYEKICYHKSMINCPFCQIVSADKPCYKLYEDDQFMAFLDTFPRVKGHSLVIPKKHYRWVYDLPNFADFWQVVLKLTRALISSLAPDFVTYVTHGLEIEHAHVHVIPRAGQTEFVPSPIKLTDKEMEEIAEKIRRRFKTEK